MTRAHRLPLESSPARRAGRRGGSRTEEDVRDVIALLRLNYDRVPFCARDLVA